MPRLTATRNPRSARLMGRFTPEEAVRVEELAKAAGLNVSEYLRQTALYARVTVKQTRELPIHQWTELNRLGVNLNQIARHMNAGGSPTPELDGLLRQLEALLVPED